MVPKEWQSQTLSGVAEKLQTGPFGSQLKASEYDPAGLIAVVMPRDLAVGAIDFSQADRINEITAKKVQKHALRIGDVLFSRRGDVRRTAVYANGERQAICGTGCLRARLGPNVDPLFFNYFLQQTAVGDWLEANAVGQTMLNLNTGIIGKLPVTLPPLPEQRRISEILSTWDRAIATVEALIGNSRIKKAALKQSLLTGKQRLPGFTDTWSVAAVGVIADEVSERAGERSNLPVLSCSKHDGMVLSLTYFKKKVYSDDTSNYKVMRRGTFGFPSNHIEEGSIGYQDITEVGIVSPIYCVFRTNGAIDDGYLHKLLKTDRYRQIFAATTNASVDRRGSLRWREFAKIQLPLPPLKEQIAISEVIDTAEQAVGSYEAQLAALRQEKSALMQQLLTGKRRVKLDQREAA